MTIDELRREMIARGFSSEASAEAAGLAAQYGSEAYNQGYANGYEAGVSKPSRTMLETDTPVGYVAVEDSCQSQKSCATCDLNGTGRCFVGEGDGQVLRCIPKNRADGKNVFFEKKHVST